MSNTDPVPRGGSDVATPTRRDFVAGASAAGAVLLNGLLARVALAHKLPKKGPNRPTCVANVTADVNGGVIVTSDDDGNLIEWQINKENRVTQVKPVPKPSHKFKAAYVAISGGSVVTAGYDGLAMVRDLSKINTPPVVINAHDGNIKPEVWVAVLSPDAKRVLLGTNDGQIQLWDVLNRQKLWSFKFMNDKDAVAGLAFLPGEGGVTQFLSTHSKGIINQWRIPDVPKVFPPPLTYPTENDSLINTVAVSEDAKMFVTGGFDNIVRVWFVGGPVNQPHRILKDNTDYVWRVAISPSKARVAAASQDGTVRVWNITKANPVPQVLNPGKYGSMGVAFAGEKAVVFTGDGANQNQLVHLMPVTV